MRILWLGNAPWVGSGYGEQANLFLPRFAALGHQLALQCNHGLQGDKLTLGPVTCYPSDGTWGNTAVSTYARQHQADLVIALHDAWVFHPDHWDDDIPPVAIWAPVDHYPIPPAVLAVLQHERVRPIAMSRFGEMWMDKFGLDPLYVPHGVDTSLFRPQPELRKPVRDMLGLPHNAFVIGMVAANKGNPEVDRKSFSKSFLAFSQFLKTHPDAYLFCHTEAQPPGAGKTAGAGRNLALEREIAGIPPDRLLFPSAEAWHLGMSRDTVARLYQAFDILLMPSMGEGFGIPLVEAQACGVPVITSNHSAMTELGQTGWLVNGDPHFDPLQESYFFDPYIPSIVAALEEAYAARGDTGLRDKAVEFAQAYDADVVTETFWKPTLDALSAPRTPSQASARGASRAERRRLARAAKKNPASGREAKHDQEVKA